MHGSQIKDLLASFKSDCQQCAKSLEEKPGLAGAASIIDLYRALDRLASIIAMIEQRHRVGF